MLQLLQKSMRNPVAVKMAFSAAMIVFLFMLCISIMRSMRKQITEERELTPFASESSPGAALGAYQGVIAQMREEQRKLRRQREEEQQQTATARMIQEAVLSNLNTGVLFLDRMGIVRQANRAAKSLLGYASPFSLHARDIFRGTTHIYWPGSGEEASGAAPLVQRMQELLRDDAPFTKTRIHYLTPAGHQRILNLTVTAVPAKDGSILGACCLLDDLTQITELSQHAQRTESLASLGEISAGVVNDFKNSLSTISGYAEMLIKTRPEDPAQREYAEKIIIEAESLARIVSQFLEFAGSARSIGN
jgi:nitrogen-specific signal transduction histidine kinase